MPTSRSSASVVDAFLAAARDGDFEGLLRVLDPDVGRRVDGGRTHRERSPGPARGRRGRGARGPGLPECRPSAEPVLVNGAAGLLVWFPARSLVAAFTVVNERIVEINIIADPAKLRGLGSD